MTRRTPNSSGSKARSGHSAFNHFKEQVKWVDLIVEVLDARAPISSRHPNSQKIFGNKPRILVLTKMDLADAAACKKWLDLFSQDKNQKAIALSLKYDKGKDKLLNAALEVTAAKREESAKKGLLPRPIRVCVVGMPNVGKSSLINWLVGRKRLKVGDRPGITKAPQWLRVHPLIELLDTPGVLPNVSFSNETALKLSLLNLLTESSYDIEHVGRSGLILLGSEYFENVRDYFGEVEAISLETLAMKRKFVTAGGKLDTRRAAAAFLTDLREGKLGKITLDQAPTKVES